MPAGGLADGPGDGEIIRTADVCDGHVEDARVCELQFRDFGGRNHFHGQVVTFRGYESNKGLRALLTEGGAGKVLVVDGRGSLRRALCGGNIAAEAFAHGWRGLVFNGAIRDSHEMTDIDMGIKALGSTAMRPSNEMEGVVGETLNFGGIEFRSGDYLYADQDCVIVLAEADHG